jgi:beta-galactosidase
MGAIPRIDIGILTDLDQEHGWSTMSHQLPGPYDQQQALLDAFSRRHFAVGLVAAQDDLKGYRALILPSFVQVDSELLGRLRTFVDEGGLLLVTAQTATRDKNNHKIATTPPGGNLKGLLGLEVIEWGTLVGTPVAIDYAGATAPYGRVYEIPELHGAEALASWQSTRQSGVAHPAVGRPALTRHVSGKGEAWYFATLAVGEAAEALTGFLADRWAVEPLAEAAPSVEITVREKGDRAFWFALNHTTENQSVAGLPGGTHLLTGEPVGGDVMLAPYGVAVIEVKR